MPLVLNLIFPVSVSFTAVIVPKNCDVVSTFNVLVSDSPSQTKVSVFKPPSTVAPTFKDAKLFVVNAFVCTSPVKSVVVAILVGVPCLPK